MWPFTKKQPTSRLPVLVAGDRWLTTREDGTARTTTISEVSPSGEFFRDSDIYGSYWLPLTAFTWREKFPPPNEKSPGD